MMNLWQLGLRLTLLPFAWAFGFIGMLIGLALMVAGVIAFWVVVAALLGA